MNNPTSYGSVALESSVKFGVNCVLWQFCTICGDTVLGESVVVGSGAWIGRDVTIGDGTRIQHGAFVPNHTKIGKRVFIGPLCVLCDDKYPRVDNPLYKACPPILEDDCNIGANATIMPGVRIGQGATVGAGSVVCQDVPPHAIVKGNPARVVPHDGDKDVVWKSK